MSLNNTPSAERLHIGIFGKRNAGKSSVINALTGQNLAIVSDIKGTTTDPVLKSMELLPLGPVVIIDTPGLDDDADVLGALRIQKAYQMLNKTDIAILVIDGTVGMTEEDKKILTRIQDKNIPYIVVLNKADLAVSKVCLGNQSDSDVCNTLDSIKADIVESCQIPSEHILWVSAQDHSNIQELKELIGKLIPSSDNDRYIVHDLIRPMDLIVLVVPIDSAAPKGRLILPQQQTIRDILESGAVSIVVRETESGFVSIIARKLKGKKYNLREAISIDEAREISEQKLRLPQRLAQPWCAERVVKQLRIDMEQHTKEWQNNPMLEGELILFLDATNHVSLDEIRLFYDEKKGLEWEVEKRG